MSDLKITMHVREQELFRAFLSAASNYYEFGMGGSTVLAAELVKQSVSAMDSDPAWVDKVREIIDAPTKRIDLRHVDIGKTGNWGTPISRESEYLFPDYSSAIVSTGRRDFDLCLVDGRFRVACFLQALQHLEPDAIVGIHDYRVRPYYFVVEQFARPVATCLSLTFFVRRHDADLTLMGNMLDQHRLDWR